MKFYFRNSILFEKLPELTACYVVEVANNLCLYYILSHQKWLWLILVVICRMCIGGKNHPAENLGSCLKKYTCTVHLHWKKSCQLSPILQEGDSCNRPTRNFPIPSLSPVTRIWIPELLLVLVITKLDNIISLVVRAITD